LCVGLFFVNFGRLHVVRVDVEIEILVDCICSLWCYRWM